MNKVKNLFSCGGNIGDVLNVFQKPLLLWGLEEGWIPKASCMDLPMSAKISLDNDCGQNYVFMSASWCMSLTLLFILAEQLSILA